LHWVSDKEHAKYCPRLREANEDEHDLRSGRRIWEFDLPGEFFKIPCFRLRTLNTLQESRAMKKQCHLPTGIHIGLLEITPPLTKIGRDGISQSC
jgi:hypothetical protein